MSRAQPERRGAEAIWDARIFTVATTEIPGPELFWMRDFGRWYPLAFHVVLLRSSNHTVLVNTGLPNDVDIFNEQGVSTLGERARVRPTRDLLGQLADAGVAPRDVTHVVLTPLQWYTTGQLAKFDRAKICLGLRGWLHFHSTHSHPHDDRQQSLPRPVLQQLVFDRWEDVQLLADEDQLAPGLRVWWSGGHHRASIVVEADTPAGTVMITDSAFHAANVRDNIPLGINESLAEIDRAYRRLRQADHLIALYDPDLMTRYSHGNLEST